MNYWPVKKNIEVMTTASFRTMDGQLISRQRIDMSKGMVLNVSPEIGDGDFEGSVEIEAFAADNLNIPYIAVMVVYEAPKSVTMVHAYTRTYTTHEVEEGKTITFGEEAGLVARDSDDVRSFMIFHNGIYEMPEQTATLWATNHDGETREVKFTIPKLNKFETQIIYPRDIIKDLPRFLDGQPGSIALSYELNGGFTRMLVGNETIDGQEMQVLHSNFNYGRHEPGYVETEEAYFDYPLSKHFEKKTVHMDAHARMGNFTITKNETTYEFSPGKTLEVPIDEEYLRIQRHDGKLPARINIVFSGFLKGAQCKLPMESARGFYHAERPRKRSLWMLVSTGKKYKSQVIFQDLEHLYGPVGDSILEVGLYREDTMEIITKHLNSEELKKYNNGIYMEDIFPEYCNKKENEFSYLYCKPTSFGGHCAFTTIEAKNGSMSIEHMF